MKYLLTLWCLSFTCIVFSQADMEVLVLDYKTNNPLAQIELSLTNSQIGFTQNGTTDKFGKVLFRGLSTSGSYTVEVLETGDYNGNIMSSINLRSNAKSSVSILVGLKKEVSLDEFTVSGSSKINAANAEVSSQLTQKELEAFPIEGRDITRALFRLPNVVQATGFYPEAPNVSINGANSLFTNYLIDGMDNNERFLGGMKFNIPVGFVKDINVLTNNFSTEYGLTANGVVNVTSKSGSNTTTGEAFFVTRPGSVIDATSPFAQRDLSGNQVRDGFQRYQAGFGLGGAIIPNKTFYYLNYEHTTDVKDNLLNSPGLGINEAIQGTNQFNYISLKLDQVWSNKFSSSLRVNQGIVAIGRQAGGLTGGVAFPSAANFQDRNSTLVASQNTYLGKNFKSETNLQYARFRWNYGRAVNEASPQVNVLDPSEQSVAVLGHPGYIFDALENTWQAQQKFTFYRGNHTIKTGGEIISADHSLLGGGNRNGNYTVKLTQGQLDEIKVLNNGGNLSINDLPSDVQVLNYNVEILPGSFGVRQNVFSAYLEDQISLSSKLNLTIGARYDVDNLSKGGGEDYDLDNIAPRTSFNYRLNSRSSIRGGYGIFYDKISYAVYSDAIQQNTTAPGFRAQLQALKDKGILPNDTNIDLITADGNFTASLPSVGYLQGPNGSTLEGQRDLAFSNERRILNPNGYQNSYTHQFSMGYQNQIGKNLLFYVDLVHNRSFNLFRVRDLNAPSSYPLNDSLNVVVRTQADADLDRVIPIVGNTAIIGNDTISGVARGIIMSETGGESRYTALSLNLQKERGEDFYSFRLCYTLSRLENNTEDINFRAQDNNDFEAEWGPSINDRTHVINGNATFYPWKGLSFTLAALFQSGQPINRIPNALRYGTTDLNGDGRSFGDAYVGNSDRQPGESRNSDRLGWANTIDLAAEYALPLGGKYKSNLIFRADVFNLFNQANLSGYSNNASQSNQIQTGSAGDAIVRRNSSAPRQFQFSLRYAF